MQAPSVVTRAEWGARPFKGEVRGLGTVRQIVIHHAAGYGAQTREEGVRQVAAIQKLHQGPARNWLDIGYHFLVDAGGNVYQGRPYLHGETLDELPDFAMGAHLLDRNSGRLGICMLGCFHAGDSGCNDVPTPQALGALEGLLRFLCASYGVEAWDVLAHRDFMPTSCPGDAMYAALAAMRVRLAKVPVDAL